MTVFVQIDNSGEYINTSVASAARGFRLRGAEVVKFHHKDIFDGNLVVDPRDSQIVGRTITGSPA